MNLEADSLSKIGRNQPCPCGSGQKYKHCHGSQDHVSPGIISANRQRNIELLAARAQARHYELQQQFGKGRPPISSQFKEHAIVAVGTEIFWNKKWKTFPDFLMHYFKHVMGREWGEAQLAKTRDQWHTLFQWYALTCEYQEENIKNPGEVYAAQMNGAVAGIMWLTYGLYLLRHNVQIQDTLLRRIRSDDQQLVFGAMQEILIASTMLWAGFELHLENEDDNTQTHCEFTAVSKETGKKYSVEVKVCDPGGTGSGRNRVFRQLVRAMKKKADHFRIICIDLNRRVPGGNNLEEFERDVFGEMGRIRKHAATQLIDGRPMPPAYVMLTNFPFRYDLAGFEFPRTALLEGLKIPGLQAGSEFPSIRALAELHEEHSDALKLVKAFSEIMIPQTLDGELPSAKFGKGIDRILVGEKYLFDGEDGKEFLGEVKQALMMEDRGEIVILVENENGQSVILKKPVSSEEMQIYKESPETFFGKLEKSKVLKDPVSLYKWFVDAHKDHDIDILLKMAREAPDYEALSKLPKAELVKELAERFTQTMLSRGAQSASTV